MGNEKSALNGLDLDDKAVEITDFWIHNTASVQGYNPRKVSIFISEPSLHYGASFGKPTPLERVAKNLMLHRHPCILRYISSSWKASKFFLTTEEVKPLIQVIDTQSTLQICIGLYSILRALIFLHEKALALHNNVCICAIYITPEGYWKLGGLEYLCKFTEATSVYYKKIKQYRYEKGISPGEDIASLITSKCLVSIDAYAFGVLAEDILKSKNSDDVPGLREFREFCKENLQTPDPQLRSKLSSILDHPFFTHDFNRIYAFLEELPLKSDAEKDTFFENLVTRLRAFPEHVVAEQLGRSLLSRMVLLDPTAQRKLLPFVLKPREEEADVERSLFAISTFKAYLVPKLLQMFCIRDCSIRLVLLSHFTSFVNMFQTDELKTQVLPELLVGIKDTNDQLVCATLRALADVASILGAATVIGGNRGKLFTDGRPNKTKNSRQINSAASSFTNIPEFNGPVTASLSKVSLPERPSPDGGEDKRDADFAFTEEECTWSDWDVQETTADSQYYTPEPAEDGQKLDEAETSSATGTTNTALNAPVTTTLTSISVSTSTNSNTSMTTKVAESTFVKKPPLSDISELDIKHSKPINATSDEFDFFTDMEPVIQKTQVLHVEQTETPSKSMFDVNISSNTLEDCEENNGWEEDLSDWGIEGTSDLKV